MSTKRIEALSSLYEATKMVGWDFAPLRGKMTVDETWWDFDADCVAEMRRASSVVDLGTGGGERLLRLLAAAPKDDRTVVATEGWEPNFPVAQRNLAPQGVEVHRYAVDHDERMPFDDERFDVVMSRHEAVDISEVARVLAPGGRFRTQQVDGRDAGEIHEWFDQEFLYPEAVPERYVAELESFGLRVESVDEWIGTREFVDVEALVAYIALVPWDAPTFAVHAHASRLAELESHRPIRISQRRFRVYATKP